MPTELEDIEPGEMDDIKPDTDEAVAAKPEGSTEDTAAAEASTAKDGSETVEDGSLSIVRDVVEKGKTKSETAASSATDEADPETGATTSKEPKARDDENFSDAPFHKHPRFKELISQRNEFRDDAQRYRNVQSFLDDQGLAAEEAAELMVIGGLMKTNPAEAWKRMKPVVETVLRAAGEILPTDLDQRVRAGEIPREAAIEISRSRATVASTEAAQRWQQQRQSTVQQQTTVQAVQGAVQSWESERQLRDPNFANKQPALLREVAFLQQTEGRPSSPEGVRAQLDKAYAAVNQNVTPVQPKPAKQATKPVVGGQVNGTIAPKVETALDAVNAVLSRRG